jgi:hypothetical protein
MNIPVDCALIEENPAFSRKVFLDPQFDLGYFSDTERCVLSGRASMYVGRRKFDRPVGCRRWCRRTEIVVRGEVTVRASGSLFVNTIDARTP